MQGWNKEKNIVSWKNWIEMFHVVRETQVRSGSNHK